MKKQIKDTKKVIIAKAGKPVANKPRNPGLLKGKISVPDNFDDESEEINKLFYGE